MGFWDWLTGNRQTTDVASPWSDNSHLEQITLAHLYELDDSNLPLNRDGAMQVPAIARARNLICTSIGRMPLLAHNTTGRRKDQPAVLTQPDPGAPALTTWTWTVDELLFNGVAWHYVLQEDSGRAVRTRVYPQSLIMFDPNGQPYGFNGQKLPNRWIRIDGPHEGILTFGRRSIRSALAIEKAYRRSAEMPVPAIDLHQTTPTPQLTKTQREELIESWVAARNGKNGAVGYTSSNIEAKALGVPAENLLVAARDAASLDMARLTGLPAWAVDAAVAGSSLTYSNITDRNRELVDYSFSPYMASIESRWSMDDVLPHGSWARFATDDWLRGDLKARAEAYSAAKAAGIMTDEDALAAERGHPIEG